MPLPRIHENYFETGKDYCHCCNNFERFIDCVEEQFLIVLKQLYGKDKLNISDLDDALKEMCWLFELPTPHVELNIECGESKIAPISRFSTEDLFKETYENLKMVGG